jgi:hypothetical protein
MNFKLCDVANHVASNLHDWTWFTWSPHHFRCACLNRDTVKIHCVWLVDSTSYLVHRTALPQWHDIRQSGKLVVTVLSPLIHNSYRLLFPPLLDLTHKLRRKIKDRETQWIEIS